MKSEQWIKRQLAQREKEMAQQTIIGMEKGWPVPFWDRNCIERALLREVLGLKRVPFNEADCMAGW